MRAVIFEDIGKLSVADHPDPAVADPSDAVVEVTTAAICGSDLHVLNGRIPGMRSGSVIGHEYVGRIVEAGSGVGRFKTGDRVVGSFPIVCGRCWFCARGEFNNCAEYRVLGYGMFTGDLDGAQAGYVRIPDADVNLHAVDAGLVDEQALFAGDVLTTGVYAAAIAGIEEGDDVAVIGAGPVGLFAIMAARAYKPARVFAIDVAADRLKMAESLGAIPVDASKVNPVVEVQRLTTDRGADVVLECVGALPAFDTAIDAVRAGGTVAVIGVYSELEHSVSFGEIWRRNITIKMGGSCNVQAYWDHALDLVTAGTIDPTVIITHTMPLEEALRGYELFEAREALKVVLKP
jgi:alcohol dehydrogenase